jgi:anti-sigma B factor antagonist
MADPSYPIAMAGGVAVVEAPQEIDAANAAWFGKVLLQAAFCGHETVVVTMTGTQFCDSAGVHALVGAHQRAVAEGGELLLVVPARGAVRRIFELTGIDFLIPNFTDLSEARGPHPRGPAAARSRRCAQPGGLRGHLGHRRFSHRGRYHTGRQPGDASQYTARCPRAPPPLNPAAGPQSHSDQLTVIRPGPHSCPFWQRLFSELLEPRAEGVKPSLKSPADGLAGRGLAVHASQHA